MKATPEIVPGVPVNPGPLVKSYAPYAPAMGVAGHIDPWRSAFDMSGRTPGSQVATYGSPLEPANVLKSDSLALPIDADIDGRCPMGCASPAQELRRSLRGGCLVR